MRRIVLASVLAVSAAVLGACESKPEAPNKPTVTPSPVVTGSPAATPAASPSASPVKPGTTPEVKKTDDKKTSDGSNVNKDVKPLGTPVKSPVNK